MNVGIITYHFARNYGAVLQCYALQEYLKSMGFNVTILNYIDEKQEKNNSIYKTNKGIKSYIINLCLIPFNKKRKIKEEKFQIFLKEKLNCSERLKNIKELQEYIEKNNIKYIISGSDQVWNPKIEDFSEAFFFNFETQAKKITYAASCGSATEDELKKYISAIKDFSLISIREKESQKMIESIVNKKVTLVGDPVILLDKNKWEKLATNEYTKTKEKYLICYFLHKPLFKKEFKIAKQIAKDKKLKIKVINARYGINSFKKGTIHDAGPENFIELLKNAEYICTDSFHGTMFSIIFKKNFSVFDSLNNKKDTRRTNILKYNNMLSRLIYIEKENMDISEIIYSKKQPIELLINESKKFLGKIKNEK